MTTKTIRTVALLAALSAAGCATAANETNAPQPAQTATRPDSAERARVEALYAARTDSLRQKFTQADVDFMAGMIHHHAQAVTMSRLAPTHGASPAVQTLAARIINSQMDDIHLMQRWLRERDQPVPEVMDMNGALMVHGSGAAMATMPGMLTPEQMDQLRAAHGAEFDRLFLTGMIQHHGGALTMVKVLFDTDGAAQDALAFKFANDVQVDQKTEIARMQLLLDAISSEDRAQ